MQVSVRFLDNLKVEAFFDDFSIIADQPVRYKGDGMAPGPFDYFLASSALCAAYFVKVYCKARDIKTDDIEIIQNNIVDPDNRYHQDFEIDVKLPDYIEEKDRKGIIASIERCTVKRVIQNSPAFKINIIKNNESTKLDYNFDQTKKTYIAGKDSSLEESIEKMTKAIADINIKLELASWRNPLENVWSVHLRDADCPINYTNGKGKSKEAALCSALGEFIERLTCNYFYNDYFLGQEFNDKDFTFYPDEKWFPLANDENTFPDGLMDDYLFKIYNHELKAHHLIDTNIGDYNKGICAFPFIRQSDQEKVYIPLNIIGNLFVSNGMSAGNTLYEARVQALCEIFERYVKNKVIIEKLTLPEVPQNIINQYPDLSKSLQELAEKGYPLYIKDASLGGVYPVMCIILMNPHTGGAYASFGAHPLFEVALERCLTELLQGRSFEGLNDLPSPSFNDYMITEHNNLIDHFIDSSGVIAWKSFSQNEDFSFAHWNFKGSTEEEFNYLIEIFNKENKEVYIADYNDLGIPACRIIVPNFSEVYLIEDLIWDNNNKCLEFRDKILNCHRLEPKELKELLDQMDNYELDDYMPISELIGVSFDETSDWARLVLIEFKLFIYLLIDKKEEALECAQSLITFSEHNQKRKMLFKIISNILEIDLNKDLKREDYMEALKKMYSQEACDIAKGLIDKKIKFYGLIETDSNFKGLDKHLRLLTSFKKIHHQRSKLNHA